jgi:pectinesterase
MAGVCLQTLNLKPMCCRILAILSAFGVTAVAEKPFKTVGPAHADFPTVQAAIDAVPSDNSSQKIILIQPGAYFGHTVLNKPRVTLRGSGPSTLLTHNLGQAIPGADMQALGWRGAAALLVTADDARIENLTLENTYGKGMQAQACSVEADRATFRRCRIIGWQDTLRIDAGRMFFEECHISGHVDFIYGSATAFFSNCEIHCREPGYIVAPSTPPGKTGLVFENCRITFPFGNPACYLGRPWRDSPSATFVRCELGVGIRPEGWREWNVEGPLVRFAEYACHGEGAATRGRAAWAIATADPAPVEFSRDRVLGDWKP